MLGPNTSPIVDAVADVNEKYRMPMMAGSAAALSIFRKGRKFIFQVPPPAEVFLEGLIELAAKRGLKTVALVHADELFGRATTQGAIELAKKKGLQVVFVDAYLRGPPISRRSWPRSGRQTPMCWAAPPASRMRWPSPAS